jgi:hypothetical protein
MKKTKSQVAAVQTGRQPSTVALVLTLAAAGAAAAAGGAALLWGILDPAALSPDPFRGAISFWAPRGATLVGGATVLFLAMVLPWRLVGRAVRPLAAAPAAPVRTAAPSPAAALQAREARLFVHLFKRLQREGRLMDFLAEDLEGYDDAQIGAAARGVHAGCRRVVGQLLAPRPVMREGEAAQVTLDAGYDAAAVTLTGQVGERPPFAGVVRHPGWRAARIEIPLLAEETDPAIIAPAEVEVLAHR